MSQCFANTLRVILCCLALGSATAGALDQHAATREASNMNAKEIIAHWIQQIDRIPADGFVIIPDFSAFASRARTESRYWCGRFLTPAADPHAPAAKAHHSYYAAGLVQLDLLRHDYMLAGQPVAVLEGVNFVIVRVPAPMGRPWTRESIAAAVRQILNLSDAEHHWEFQYPPRLDDDTLISTDSRVDPVMMHSWGQRADLLIQPGRLFLICYKRYPATLGFVHDGQWLENELRTGK